MKVTKCTEIIKGEGLEGFTDVCDGRIGINIELIWKQERNEAKFIKRFSNTLWHELLHREILKILPKSSKNYYYGEEKVVRLITGERWRRGDREYYINGGKEWE